ncbi:MAG: MarR family winged helix-turn-helix transcriptional regulator [Oscillospiraceae bacterium]
MDVYLVEKFFDMGFRMRQLPELLPQLPEGFKPGYIRVLKSIYKCSQKQKVVRVSDISNIMNVTMPGITKILGELEEKKLVKKLPVSEDGRLINLVLTPQGEKIVQKHITEYHSALAARLPQLSNEECEEALKVFDAFYGALLAQRQQDS